MIAEIGSCCVVWLFCYRRFGWSDDTNDGGWFPYSCSRGSGGRSRRRVARNNSRMMIHPAVVVVERVMVKNPSAAAKLIAIRPLRENHRPYSDWGGGILSTDSSISFAWYWSSSTWSNTSLHFQSLPKCLLLVSLAL